jgi:hypothetical protein
MRARAGQQALERIQAFEEELRELVGGFPGEDLGWSLADSATCQELRKAAALLRSAVYLLRRASDREMPQYEAMAGVIEERGGAVIQ